MPTIGGVGCNFFGHEKEDAAPNDTTDRFDARDGAVELVVGPVPDPVLRTGRAVADGASPCVGAGSRRVVALVLTLALLHPTATIAATTIAGSSTVPRCL
ncbi:MAG TPA: hypothetical protein VGO03_13500 [Acidimicrobiia bacterium]|jgi:hypothetical protein